MQQIKEKLFVHENKNSDTQNKMNDRVPKFVRVSEYTTLVSGFQW